MNNIISIIMPFYNSEKFINTTLECIKSQENDKFELILINDGSTDKSVDKIKKFMSTNSDMNIVYVNCKKNFGVSHARNLGIKKSTGRYLLFLDSDDYIYPNMTKSLRENIEKFDLIVAGIKVETKDKKMKNSLSDSLIDKSEIVKLIEKSLLNTLCNKLFLRDIIIKNNIRFNDKIKVGEDLMFVLEYIKNITTKIKIIDDIVYKYLLREDGSNMKVRYDSDKNAMLLRDTTISYAKMYYGISNEDIKYINLLYLRDIFRRYKIWLFIDNNYIHNYIKIIKSFRNLNLSDMETNKKFLNWLVRFKITLGIFIYFYIEKIKLRK